MAATLPRSVIANQRARWCGNPFLPLAALVLQFVHIVTARRENCGLPLPVARRVKQTCRWHVCSQSGEQALLATWKKQAGHNSRSRRLRGPSQSRPENGNCGKALTDCRASDVGHWLAMTSGEAGRRASYLPQPPAASEGGGPRSGGGSSPCPSTPSVTAAHRRDSSLTEGAKFPQTPSGDRKGRPYGTTSVLRLSRLTTDDSGPTSPVSLKLKT